MNNEPLIVGAGLAGLLAAHAWPKARIIDIAPFPKARHQALLRFRSDSISKLTGIEFKKVTVRKSIFYQNAFVEPNPCVCNLYAQKVVGWVAERSVWNINPVERYIAPEDFYEQLIDTIGARIEWGTKYDPAMQEGRPVISTIPMMLMLQHHALPITQSETQHGFTHKSIRVKRWRILNSHVYQTVYFPDLCTPLYRASITDDMLIAEVIDDWDGVDHNSPLMYIEKAFGLNIEALNPLGSIQQPYGKLVALEDAVRKSVLFNLTTQHNIYSLGRFATWRNVMLDDVVNDITFIKRLMKVGNAYDARKETL